MTRAEATETIRAKFPNAKVMFADDMMFTDGIGVELNGKRNAYTITTMEELPEAVNKLIIWLEDNEQIM